MENLSSRFRCSPTDGLRPLQAPFSCLKCCRQGRKADAMVDSRSVWPPFVLNVYGRDSQFGQPTPRRSPIKHRQKEAGWPTLARDAAMNGTVVGHHVDWSPAISRHSNAIMQFVLQFYRRGHYTLRLICQSARRGQPR